MKIRTDFVTNSSSSSFLVEITVTTKDDTIQFESDSHSCEGNGRIFITHSPEELGHCSTVSDLIEMMEDALADCCEDWDHFGEKDSEVERKEKFFKSLRSIESMDDIEQIDMVGVNFYQAEEDDEEKQFEWYDGMLSYTFYCMDSDGPVFMEVERYNKSTGKTMSDYCGKRGYEEGDGGCFDFDGFERRNEYGDD